MFEVYTYFGRRVSLHEVGDALHFHALEAARVSLDEFETSTGHPAWIRFKFD